ncbi:MAG: hypothetical protein GWP03_04795 [Proteobacteria bacterium]|nr:hypothetical protein [Pseudomonadota bacterium]
MKILYIFDSFKNSLRSQELGELATKISSESDNKNIYLYLPVGDGGEGSLQIIESFVGGNRIKLNSVTADGYPLETYYLMKDKTAFIEVAMTSGMEKLKNKRTSILKRNTYGTGIVLKDAMTREAKEIILFVGGTATCDGGIGIIKALNNARRDAFLIHRLRLPEYLEYKNIKMTIATDVTNPLLGSKGAAYVFAAQKGACKKEIEHLESKMQELRELAFLTFEKDIDFEGAGAGGGIPALLSAYFDVNITSGFDYIASIIDLDRQMEQSDIIITGEGKFDKQSFMGKVVGRVIEKANKLNKKVAIVCGTSTVTASDFPIFQLSGYKRSIFDKEEAKTAFLNMIKSLTLYKDFWT